MHVLNRKLFIIISVALYFTGCNVDGKKKTVNVLSDTNKVVKTDMPLSDTVTYDSVKVEPLSPKTGESANTNNQLFKIDASKENIINGKEGTVIILPPNIFSYGNGEDCKSGTITVSLEEYYKKSDLVLNSITTMTTDNKVLESFGMVNIQANEGKRKLKVKEGSEFYVIFKSEKGIPKDASLYNGKVKNGQVKWALDTDFEEEAFLIDPITGIKTPLYSPQQELFAQYAGQVFGSGKLGWLNCDMLYDIPNKTTLMISTNYSQLPEIYFITENAKAIIPAENTTGGKKTLYNIPDGQKGNIVSIYKDNTQKKDYFALLPFISGTSKEVSITLTESNRKDIKRSLKVLN